MIRPEFTPPANIPAALQDAIVASSKRKWIVIGRDGSASWHSKAEAMKRKELFGLTVLPPEVA